jgi:hypothetical protein
MLVQQFVQDAPADKDNDGGLVKLDQAENARHSSNLLFGRLFRAKVSRLSLSMARLHVKVPLT